MQGPIHSKEDQKLRHASNIVQDTYIMTAEQARPTEEIPNPDMDSQSAKKNNQNRTLKTKILKMKAKQKSVRARNVASPSPARFILPEVRNDTLRRGPPPSAPVLLNL